MANFFESLYYTDPIDVILPFISIFLLTYILLKRYFLLKFKNAFYAILISLTASILVARLFITLTNFIGRFGNVLRVVGLMASILIIYNLRRQKFK